MNSFLKDEVFIKINFAIILLLSVVNNFQPEIGKLFQSVTFPK